jgi:RNA polymerase sigma factor (sigma-70 family)
MTSGPLRTVMRYLQKVAAPDGGGTSDGDLLRRFVARRDESAFAALVERHGPLVLGVCRRVLQNPSDAEDAFQAAFIVLACKARSISQPDLLSSWLYRVAYRTALRAWAASAARKDRQALVGDVAVAPMAPDADWADLRPVLDEEIERLPTKYRVPFVLCYLEGRTNDEAARRVGCAKGTIGSRLAWARQRLRSRLVRRGVTLPAGLLATALTSEALSAAVPPSLANVAVGMAMSFRSGPALAVTASTAGATLAKGVLRAMFLTRLRTLTIWLTVLGLVGAGTGFYFAQPGADAQQQPPAVGGSEPKAPQPPAAGSDGDAAKKLQELLTQRRDVATLTFNARRERLLNGQLTGGDEGLHAAALRLVQAELDLCRDRAARIKVCEIHLSRMREIEQIALAQVTAGKIFAADGAVAEYSRLDAEIRLQREKAR